MPGKNPYVNLLNSRKQLLIAESELNRAGLVQDWQTMADDVHTLASRARNIGVFASAAAALVASIASFRRKKTTSAVDEKPSWWRTVFKSAGTFYMFWRAFRPQSCGQKEQ
jgi:hypothetical protein